MTEPKRTRRTRRVMAPADAPVLAYLRVSTEEQATSGAGLDAQRAAIMAEAERRGWGDRVQWIEDAGFSASTMNRPGIARALDLLASGKASVLIAAKVDRLSRSIGDFDALTKDSEREGWALVALDLGLDTTTATGKMLAGMLSVFAAFEKDLIRDRTRQALATRKAQGLPVSGPGLDRALRHRLAGMVAAGMTYRAIAATLNAEGMPTARRGTWHPSTVQKALLVK